MDDHQLAMEAWERYHLSMGYPWAPSWCEVARSGRISWKEASIGYFLRFQSFDEATLKMIRGEA